MILSDTQKQWNNTTLDYDLVRFNWPDWALRVIQEIAPQVKELETLHEVLTPAEIVVVSKYVQNSCNRRDFMELFDEFVETYVPDRIMGKQFMIQRQGTLRVVIPNQADVGRRLQFHQGIFVGNGRGCRTIWTPFTEARGTNTMWMVDLDNSRRITKDFMYQKWDLKKLEDECLKVAFPIELKPGQSHLFFQEMLHGNVNNTEGYTRVSMDMRILIEGEEYGRRHPGGFMRLSGDHEVAKEYDYSSKKAITYVGWSSDFSRNIPLPMQRAIIDQYCEKNKIAYTSYEFENDHCDWQPSLAYFIMQKPDLIVLNSMYSLTDDLERRNELLHLALDYGVELHFANELISLKNKQDLAKIETYLNFAIPKGEPYVWENNDTG